MEQKAHDAIAMVVRQLPLMNVFTNHEDRHTQKIYGGFIRFFFEYYRDHDVFPEYEQAVDYLIDHDLDLHIRNFQRVNHTDQGVLFREAWKLGGIIEYVGNDYFCGRGGVWNPPKKEEYKLNETGNGFYRIWLPGSLFNRGEDIWVRYDCFISDMSALEWNESLTVNDLQFYILEAFSQMFDHHFRSQDIQDILNKSCRFHHMNRINSNYITIKKVYRLGKMYRLGYRVIDPKQKEFVKKVIPLIEQKLSKSKEVPYTILENLKPPSKTGPKKIQSSSNLTPLTLEIWYREMRPVYSDLDITPGHQHID